MKENYQKLKYNWKEDVNVNVNDIVEDGTLLKIKTFSVEKYHIHGWSRKKIFFVSLHMN
jgi:hypothetical protein